MSSHANHNIIVLFTNCQRCCEYWLWLLNVNFCNTLSVIMSINRNSAIVPDKLCLQWNPFKMDTIGETTYVLYMEVSLFLIQPFSLYSILVNQIYGWQVKYFNLCCTSWIDKYQILENRSIHGQCSLLCDWCSGYLMI